MAKKTKANAVPDAGCVLKILPDHLLLDAAKVAVEQSSTNAPQLEALPTALVAMIAEPGHLAVLTSKRWSATGVNLGVSFVDSPDTATRNLILSHMNSWNETANVKFTWSQSNGQVRISRDNSGHWSYLGTDVLLIPKSEATMNLEGFTASTPDAECRRVVRHETGHTLGFPHEHLRKELVARLDVEKTLIYFRTYHGWSEETTRDNVLLSLEDWSIMQRTVEVDEDSIMTYSLPGAITKNGKPIRGGKDIDALDRAFIAGIYPLPVAPPPAAATIELTIPPGTPPGKYKLKLGG